MPLNKIVIIRHAHRDTHDREQDNGLNAKGKARVQELKEAYKGGQLPKGDVFLSSPKNRCLETITPLAEISRAKTQVHVGLNERTSEESESKFLLRLKNFLDEIFVSPEFENTETIYLCSHGDVLPELINEFADQWYDIKKGQAIVFVRKGNKWKEE